MESTTTNPAIQRSPRRIWRTARWVLLALGVLVGLHLGWGQYEQHELMQMIDQHRRTGEPMLPEDFDRLPLPDADNAVVDLRAAAASIDVDDPRFDALCMINPAPPLTKREIAVIKSALEMNDTTLKRVDVAAQKRGVDWVLHFRTPAMNVPLPDLNRQDSLCKIVAADIYYAHQTGDDSRSLRRMRQLAFMSRATDEQPLLTSHLVSLGMSEVLAARIQELAPVLALGGQSPEGSVARSASVAQVKALINDLLDQDHDLAASTRAMQGERMKDLDSAMGLADGRINSTNLFLESGKKPVQQNTDWAETFGRYRMRPLVLGDARLVTAYMTQMVAAAGSPDWPACKARIPGVPGSALQSPSLHPLAPAYFSAMSQLRAVFKLVTRPLTSRDREGAGNTDSLTLAAR
jgi:hypothetical protein